MKTMFYYETKLGKLGIIALEQNVLEIFFGEKKVEIEEKETPFIKQVYLQIQEYLSGKRQQFTIPFSIKGTSFQKKVYEALLTIPYGETRTYEQIAIQIGHPKACRAVGSASGKNLLWLLIPCHRVIGKNGNLTGYAGGLGRKIMLLKLERGEYI